MGRWIICALAAALLAVSAEAASGAVPGSSSGGAYTVRIGADRTGFSNGESWQGVSQAADRLRSGSNGFGAYYVMGNTSADPQFGDRAGWRLTVPSGVRLTSFSVDVSTDSWVARRWTSGLRYTLSATDGEGTVLGAPLLSCRPTLTANDCPQAFKSDATRVFTAPAGTRRVELLVECVQEGGCSRTANPDGGPGGNEYAAVEGGTFNFEDDTAPALTSGSGSVWSDASRWFHNADTAVAGMGATDNSGVGRIQWYVDGSLAYDTSGPTSAAVLQCNYAFFKPCGDAGAQFPLDRSLFTIPDGDRELAVVARDAAGNVSLSVTRHFRVDDSPPPPVAVRVREGSALRYPGPWHLDFTVPPELGGASVESAMYRLCAASNSNDCTPVASAVEGVAGKAPGDAASVAVSPPSQGDWTARVWLTDAAGNLSEANASDPVLIRFGQSAPVADPLHPPTLSGDFTDGNRIRVSATGFEFAGGAGYAFQWLRCDVGGGDCSAIAGATAQDYVLVHADAGHTMRARVTATNAKGSDSAITDASSPVALLPPVDGSAKLSGTLRAGEALSVEDVAFGGTPPFDLSYAWLRCSSGACDPIAGAADATYVLGDDDVGQEIRATVTATNTAGSAQALVRGDGDSVRPAPPRSTVAPGVPAGEAKVGKTLTADDGSWAGSQPMSFGYVWQRCSGASGPCVAIAGGAAKSYELVAADLGKVIRVLVSARNGGEPVGPVASERTGVVVAANPEPAPGDPEPAEPATPEVPAAPALPPAPMPAAPAAPGPPRPAAHADLSKIPGNLVGAATCKVVRATPKTRKVRLRGIGRVTFGAAVPARVTAADPLRLSLRAPRRRVRSVAYRVGRRTVGRSRMAPYRVAVRPRALQLGGTQELTALVKPRRGKVARARLRLNVAACPSLLTAGVRFTGARAVTQLRLFARTSIRGGSVTIPARLVPKLRAGKRAGTLTLTAADGKPHAKPLVAAPGGRLYARAGISVRRAGRSVVFGGIPAGTGIVQIDLTGPRRPAWRLLQGRKTLRFGARLRAAGIAPQRLVATIKPRGRRR